MGRSKVGVCEGGVGVGDGVSCSLCVSCSGKVLALPLGSQLLLTSSEGEDGVGDGGPAEERLKIFIVCRGWRFVRLADCRRLWRCDVYRRACESC
jgi:hypothetical protein